MLTWWERLLFFGAGVGSAAAIPYLYWRVLAVWKGDHRPHPTHWPVTVYGRSYLTSVLLVTALFGGIALLMLAAVVERMELAMVGIALMFATVPLGVLHWCVNAFNRPRFLVPPPYRDQRGEWAGRRLRRQRKRAGLPPTEHLVKLYELPLDEHDDGPSSLCAICDDEECGWLEFADHEEADEERVLREKAARHTTRTLPPVIPWPPDPR